MKGLDDIERAIEARHSVRSFDGRAVSADVLHRLIDSTLAADNPFGNSYALNVHDFALTGPQRPGTYGTISGASTYLMLACSAAPESVLAMGFAGEYLALAATEEGIGSCWIGGTFKASAFERVCSAPAGMALKAVMPLGYPAARQSLRARLTGRLLGASRRKPFGELFYKDKFDTPLSEVAPYAHALAMMRLAPSSVNSQPWRAVLVGDTVHFYYRDKSSYALLDMGIGLCHFYLAAPPGRFLQLDDAPPSPGQCRYLMSYKALPQRL
ncbi:MAG: nitroreductase family protein [Muribaculaceae bacterium]|nr:nitroreductase family protein [Muribaculaceae bacterium]